MFVHTGDYIEQVGKDTSRSTYYTFTPRSLLDGDFYAMDDALASILAATHRSLGILEGVLLSFSEQDSFSELMLLKEGCFSKMIDYPGVDLCSVLANRGLSKTNDEIDNIASAYHLVLDDNAHKANCNDIARYAMLGSYAQKKVNFRSEPAFLSKSISNYRQYNPTAPKDIHSAMNDIGKYLELDGVDALIKAAMSHYQFEMIHPYEHYNGVIGRILAYKTLFDAGLKGMRYLSLSECLYQRKAEYFEKLALTQKNGTYSSWIEFFIRAINEAAQTTIESANGYIALTRTDDAKLTAHEDKKHHTADVYNFFKKYVVSNIGQVSEQLQLSFNTVSRAIDVLQGLDILTQITSKSRNRLFAHKDLMQFLLPK